MTEQAFPNSFEMKIDKQREQKLESKEMMGSERANSFVTKKVRRLKMAWSEHNVDRVAKEKR